MKLNKKIMEKARKFVLEESKRKFKEAVKEKYKELVFESEKVKADGKKMAELRKLQFELNKISACGMGDAYKLDYLRERMRGIIHEKKYHPGELKLMEKEIMERAKKVKR